MEFGGKKYTVIGVVNDMVTNSPYRQVEPALFLGDGYISEISMRLKPGTTLAIFISCLGLFGLAKSFVGAASPRSELRFARERS